MSPNPQFKPQDYTVCWLCAIAESELSAARAILDREHAPPIRVNNFDKNTYHFGDIQGHNVVITCMPPAQHGLVSAQRLVQPLSQSFPKLRIYLFVGIGGGIPRNPSPEDPNMDIHLGDVVVSWPDRNGIPAFIPHDRVELQDNGTSRPLGLLDKPDSLTLAALNSLLSDRASGKTKFHYHLQKFAGMKAFQHPGLPNDILFEADYPHVTVGPNRTACGNCCQEHLSKRPNREYSDPQFHQGTIISGNATIQNAQVRDSLASKYYNAICIETEAAGVIDDTHCLVIRGISDYADGHKLPRWEYYAAATAAAFARELLNAIQPWLLEQIKHEYNDPTRDVLSRINQGERYRRARHGREAEDLDTALHYFLQARDIILQSAITDPEINLKVYFRLMTVELDMSHNGNSSIEDMLAHHRQAEEYGDRAKKYAHDVGKAYMIRQVRLERCFLKGRKAELGDKKGSNPSEFRRLKDEVMQEMMTTMEELRVSNRQLYQEYEVRVSSWQKRLS